MKKLVCIALFSIAIMANATEKKKVIGNNSKEIVKNIKGETEIVVNNSLNVMFFGCGSEANRWYNVYREHEYNHREARYLRRVWVRKCRGNGPNGWWSILIFWA